MEQNKKAVQDDRGISAKSYLFASELDEDKSVLVLPKESTKSEATVQTKSKSSGAIRQLMAEVEELETVEECDLYWKQLAKAFVLLNF